MTSPEAAARPEPGRLVVILSPENSGSTMLAAALGGHPRVVAPPELHLFRHPDFDVWAQELPKARASLTWLLDALGAASAGDDLEARYGGWSVADVYRDLVFDAMVFYNQVEIHTHVLFSPSTFSSPRVGGERGGATGSAMTPRARHRQRG